MNNLHITTYTIFAALLFAACSHEKDDVCPIESNEITIRADVGQMSTKKSLKLGSSFDVGDEISVYAWLDTAGFTAENLYINNAVNTLNGDGKWSAAQPMSWKDAKSKHYFLGVYPQKALTNFTSDEYTLNTSDQEASDILVATNTDGVLRQSAAVPLTFTHIMARLDVNIKVTNFTTTPTSVTVSINGMTEANINYLRKEVVAKGDKTDITLPAVATVNGYLLSSRSIVVPQSGINRITVKVDGETFVYVSDKDFATKGGCYTTINLNLKHGELTLSDVDIVDWNSGAEINGKLSDLPCGGDIAEAVDLGLSVKWASWNIGAFSPEQYGGYYAWGETDTKDYYDWDTYKFIQNGYSDALHINKYQIADGEGGIWYARDFIGDGKTIFDLEDDAAAVNWGGDWVIPTEEDWRELYDNCKREWSQDGARGMSLIGKNGNSIFLPVTGYCDGNMVYNGYSYGDYWASTLAGSTILARCAEVYEGSLIPSTHQHRQCGLAVRPICKSNGNTNDYDAIDLGLPSGKLWATCNIGADTPESKGNYYAWGETQVKNEYTYDNYAFVAETNKSFWGINKYSFDDNNINGVWYNNIEFVGDSKTELESIDDAATINWGNQWRIPTQMEWQELYDNTTQTTISDYNGTGIMGFLFTSKITGYTDQSIFIPAAGRAFKENISGSSSGGDYWSSSLSNKNNYAYGMDFSVNYYLHPKLSYSRNYGLSIRPVYPKE